MNTAGKIKKLERLLKGFGSVLVAFSGGVDSTFLLAVSVGVLKDNLLAVTGISSTIPKSEITQLVSLAKKLKVSHKFVINTLSRKFWKNSAQRCYYCKRQLFKRLKQLAVKNKLKYVIDATNVDDYGDYRPGIKALRELGVRSPLKEAGLTKLEIRTLSHAMGLETWKKPAIACLASRIPYGEQITPEKLLMIDKAEEFIRKLGFAQVRVRFSGQTARIEVAPEKISLAMKMNRKISTKLKSIGFIYVSIDLDGYCPGSLNRALLTAQ